MPTVRKDGRDDGTADRNDNAGGGRAAGVDPARVPVTRPPTRFTQVVLPKVRVPGAVPALAAAQHSALGGERHHDALHNPIAATAGIGLSRFREDIGGGMLSRLVVAKYSTIDQGYPCWHVVMQVYRDDVAVEVERWGRAARRFAARTADDLLRHHGEGPVLQGGPGLDDTKALHRLRHLTRAEMGHLPTVWLERRSIELAEEASGAE